MILQLSSLSVPVMKTAPSLQTPSLLCQNERKTKSAGLSFNLGSTVGENGLSRQNRAPYRPAEMI